MRTIRYTNQFKRDFKREKFSRHGRNLEAELKSVLDLLMSDSPLPHRYFDHPLVGEWRGFRDCHIRPDLVLIYGRPDAATLEVVRLGSHSELGL